MSGLLQRWSIHNSIAHMRSPTLCLGLTSLLALGFQPAFGHSGGLNSAGCHNNRRTGNYHCHGGGYSGGGYGSPAPEPVCEDVTSSSTDITLVMSDGRRKSASNVSVKKVSAQLGGVTGSLYSYTVEGLAVRYFADSTGSNSKFSFAQSPWIPVAKTEQVATHMHQFFSQMGSESRKKST